MARNLKKAALEEESKKRLNVMGEELDERARWQGVAVSVSVSTSVRLPCPAWAVHSTTAGVSRMLMVVGSEDVDVSAGTGAAIVVEETSH